MSTAQRLPGAEAAARTPTRAAFDISGQRVAGRSAIRKYAWVLTVVAITLLISELPRVVALCCAPAGETGFGTAWFVNDFAQYESAMRQGAEQPGWLIHDPFTPEAHAPAFMFPLYVGIGKVAATLHLPAATGEQVVEVFARLLLVFSVWRFCRAFARGRLAARWACALTLFGSGFELFAAPLGGYAGNWSYELNGFGLLFAAPHVPLAMSATLELARDCLRPRRSLTAGWLLKIGALGAVLALLHPFHVPVLLGAIGIAGLVFWRSGRGSANIAGALVACLASLPVLAPTVATFYFDRFWFDTYSAQNVLPSPAPHQLLIDLGPTLLLALGGTLVLRARVAPFGLLLWLLLALIAMYLPVPYQRRLAFGIQPIVGIVGANFLIAATARLSPGRARVLKQVVVAAAASSTVLILVSVLASGFRNTPLPLYRSTTDLDAAASWLDAQAAPDQVILADWEASNYLAPRTPARMYGGHPVATLHPDEKQFAIASVFAHPSSALVARALGANWLVYGPAEAGLSNPSEAPAFQSGAVRVYRVSPEGTPPGH